MSIHLFKWIFTKLFLLYKHYLMTNSTRKVQPGDCVSATVLLADDDEAERLLVELTLRRYLPRVKLYAFASGALLLDFLARSPFLPDLVLIDLELPGLSGVELYRQLQQRGDYKAIPLLIMTASQNRQELAGHHALSAELLHAKPSTLEGLAAIIAYQLAKVQ